jgi:hypothetical protein
MNEFWLWVQNLLPLSYFEEAVDKEEEFCETAGKW